MSTESASAGSYSKGLEGVIAGESAICTVGRAGDDLLYRGYSVYELVKVASFEDVAAMLVLGEKPNPAQSAEFARQVVAGRRMSKGLMEVLDRIPATSHPMDVLRTGLSYVGNTETEDGQDPAHVAARLMGVAPSIAAYWWNVSQGKPAPKQEYAGTDQGGYFLKVLLGREPSEFEKELMNTSLILYAEHGFNASTFTARVVTSTNADMYGAVTAAVAALKGNLHGGANEAAMEMCLQFSDAEDAEKQIMGMLARKDKIMGFGHRVYKVKDPRDEVIKGYARRIAEQKKDFALFDVFERVEAVMRREKKMFPNADFWHAYVYYSIGLPIPLYTPIFVFSRLSGWCAHILEQRVGNRIIRPTEAYTGPQKRCWT